MAGKNEHTTLRLASYNIRKARGLDRRHDPLRILNVINLLAADIVVLQEADHRFGDRPSALPHRAIEEETDFEPLSVGAHDASLGWHGNAVLLRKGIAAAGVTRISLPGLEPRGAVAFSLATQNPVTVVATHLGLMRRHRTRQLETISEMLADTENAIILGDFNEWSPRRGFEPLGERFTVLSPGRSFHAARPVAALDRIAHTGEVTVQDAGVKENSLTQRASDHLPIWAEIALDAV